MNITKSGAFAVGAPHSHERMVEEVAYSHKMNDFTLLLATEEGRGFLRMAAWALGAGMHVDFEGVVQYTFVLYREKFESICTGFTLRNDYAAENNYQKRKGLASE